MRIFHLAGAIDLRAGALLRIGFKQTNNLLFVVFSIKLCALISLRDNLFH